MTNKTTTPGTLGEKPARKTTTGKTPAKKVSAKKVSAEQVARKTSTRQASTKKTTKQASARKAPTKKIARQASAKPASAKQTKKPAPARRTTKSPAKRDAPAQPGVPTPVLAGPLGDWVQRVDAAAAVLTAESGVRVLARWQGRPVEAAVLDAVEAKLGISLGAAVRNLYLQADGLALVWAPKGEGPKPVRGRPTMMFLEQLGDEGGAIALWPIAEVFGLHGEPAFDYARFLDDPAPRWGFDFPGNDYTPAYVRVGDDLQVQVGDDHGAAWDGPSVSLERYLEGVLATWGNRGARARHFVTGTGAAVDPLALARLLPTPAVRDEKRLLRALHQALGAAHQGRPRDPAWLELARQGLHARDEVVVSHALQLCEQIGAPAAELRGELSAVVARGLRLWEVGGALAALPPAPLGRDFAPLLAYAATTPSPSGPLARVLATSLELDADPQQRAQWQAALAGRAPTVWLSVLHLRTPALREAAEHALAGPVAALEDEPRSPSSGEQYVALAWADLHPDDPRPTIVSRLRSVLEDSHHLDLWLERGIEWPALGACLEDVLHAVSRATGDQRPALARALARRGPEAVAALNRLLDADEDPDDRYHRGILLAEVAPALALDATTRARIARLT